MSGRLSRLVRIAKPKARALPGEPDRLRIKFIRGGREILVLDLPNTNVQTESGIRRVREVAGWESSGFDGDAGECLEKFSLEGVNAFFELVECGECDKTLGPGTLELYARSPRHGADEPRPLGVDPLDVDTAGAEPVDPDPKVLKPHLLGAL